MVKRIVLDTNVLISAIGWKGKPHKLLQMVSEGHLELAVSTDQFEELSRVLEYPRLDFSYEQKARIKELILTLAILLKPKIKLNVVRNDPSDNMILEAALASESDYIITGDHHLLGLGEFEGIKIIKVERAFKELFP